MLSGAEKHQVRRTDAIDRPSAATDLRRTSSFASPTEGAGRRSLAAHGAQWIVGVRHRATTTIQKSLKRGKKYRSCWPAIGASVRLGCSCAMASTSAACWTRTPCRSRPVVAAVEEAGQTWVAMARINTGRALITALVPQLEAIAGAGHFLC